MLKFNVNNYIIVVTIFLPERGKQKSFNWLGGFDL